MLKVVEHRSSGRYGVYARGASQRRVTKGKSSDGGAVDDNHSLKLTGDM